MTLDNFKYILFKWKMTKDAIWNSLYLSLSAAFVTMLAGVMISYVIVKMKVRGKWFLEFLGVLPFSVPGTVIALGVILMWSGKFGINIYNTAWIIFVAYIARYMAFSLKSNSAALEQVHDSLVEAARACGASHWQAMREHRPAPDPAGHGGGLLPDLFARPSGIDHLRPPLRADDADDRRRHLYPERGRRDGLCRSALSSIALVIIVLGHLIIKRITRSKIEGTQ